MQELGRASWLDDEPGLGSRRKSRSSLTVTSAFSLSLALALTHTQVVFSSKLAAETPMGGVSWGEAGRVTQSPLTLENKPKQPRRLMTQYTSGNRGPFPLGWAGTRRRRRETQTQRMHNYDIWLLFLGN